MVRLKKKASNYNFFLLRFIYLLICIVLVTLSVKSAIQKKNLAYHLISHKLPVCYSKQKAMSEFLPYS